MAALRSALAREMAILLAIKFVLIALAGFFLFGADHRLHVDKEVVAQRLLD